MIWDSQPWKASLIKDADELSVLRLNYEGDDVEAEIAFEKTVFVAGFAIRKLLEAKKLTQRVENLDVKCHKSRLIDPKKIPDHMNWHRPDEFYDHKTERKANVKLWFFVNQLIHSFIFALIVDLDKDEQVHGFFVATDKDRGKFLYRYEIGELIRVMKIVGNDEVVPSKMERDEKGDWIVHNEGAKDVKPKRDSRKK